MTPPIWRPRDVQLDSYSAQLLALARSAHEAGVLVPDVTRRLVGTARSVRLALAADAPTLAIRWAGEVTKMLATIEGEPELVRAMKARVAGITRVVSFNAKLAVKA